jgi:hypothetical protein
MRRRVAKIKRATVADYEKRFKERIKDYIFKRGDLVLMRNTAIESSLNRKLYARYLGPMIVLRRNERGTYVLAEMDGSVYGKRVAAFRVVPYYQRHAVELPEDLSELTGVPDSALDQLPDEEEEPAKTKEDLWFQKRRLRPQFEEDSDNENLEGYSDESDGEVELHPDDSDD